MKKYIKNFIPKYLLKKYNGYRINQENRKYNGDDVRCPICNSNFKIFKSYGVIKRSNAECHNCGSLERHRLLYKYLDEKVNFFQDRTNIKMLHFAPEQIFYNIFSEQENIEYIPCDLFPEKYQFRGKSEIIKVDITNIPFENDFFDFIICNHVLEHIPNDTLAMSELYRVMKTPGWGIFQVPLDYERNETYEDLSIISPEERVIAFGQHDHVRIYGTDYMKRLEAVGFIVNIDNFVTNFSEIELFKYGLQPSEKIFYCTK